MPKQTNVVKKIASLLPPPRIPHWYMRGTPEQLAVLEQVAAAWRSGRLGPSARAVAMPTAQVLSEHGIQVSPYMVREWLGKLKRS